MSNFFFINPNTNPTRTLIVPVIYTWKNTNICYSIFEDESDFDTILLKKKGENH